MLERRQALYHQAMAQSQAMHMQVNAQMAQQAMGQNYLNQGLQQGLLSGLQPQSMQNMLYGDCTCVPGRAALLRGDH
jgi:hypothetical protein